MHFSLMSMSSRERKSFYTWKEDLANLRSFMPQDAFDPVLNNLVKYLFFKHFHLTFHHGKWICTDQKAAGRLKLIEPYFRENFYPPIDTMVKYANMELERLKEERNPQASRCSVCTPVDATSNGAAATATEEFDVESISSLVESAKHLEKEILALTAEIKKGLRPNSAS